MAPLVTDKVRNQTLEEESLAASLTALLELADPAAQANGLSSLAVGCAGHQPLRALEFLQVAFKLAPHSSEVMRSIEKVFNLRGDRSAQTKFAELRSDEDMQSTRIKHLDEFQTEGRGTRIVSSVAEAVVKRQPETRVDAQPYSVFREFIKNSKLNIKFLEFTVEFSDDWVGLVQFVSYLFVGKHIIEEDTPQVASRLHALLKDSCPNIKAHVRFSELIEPRLVKKS